MLIAVERLLIKLRQPRSRADELIELRQRLRAEVASNISEEERELAREVHTHKLAVAAELDAVSSCRTCAKGEPEPGGHWDGGSCCGGVTADLFGSHEVGALAHAGSRPSDLVAPTGDHAGCAFRGATGCTLELAHRPARCVHYLCGDLRRELHARGKLRVIEDRSAELSDAMRRYSAVHQARLDREVLEPLIDALGALAATSPRRHSGRTSR